MGISEGLEGGKGIDCSVGTIVWVRRRNGSWWPGRILGQDELSASHLMSPRSGTPVKLLGREDASVDWYNLEKSKRVKAFRCGEFDDCIRRAESSQGIPPKKREKYARREDAIIHALELEKQHYEKKRQKLGIGSNCLSNKMIGTSNKQLGSYSSPENFMGNEKARDHCRYINLKSQTPSKKLDSSLEEESMCNLLHIQKGKHVKPTWEDDNSEATPRMRGLQDFGLRTATSKRKLSTSLASRGSRKPFSVDELYDLPSFGHNIGTLDNDKNYTSAKSKRAQGGVAEESLIRRRDRRRPLVQVLQSSAKLPVCQSLQSDGDEMSITLEGEKEQVGALFQAKRSKCVYLPVESNDHLDHKGFPSEQMQMSSSHYGVDNSLIHPGSLTEEYTSSGLMEAQESDSSEGDFLDPDIKEDETLLSGPANLGRYINCGGSIYQVPVQAGNMGNEELDESELSSYIGQLHPREQTAGIASGMGGSKWQLKGKRNSRNLTKRPMELIDGKDSAVIANKCNLPTHKSLTEDKGNARKTAIMNSQRVMGRQALHHRGEELSYTYEEGDLIENYLEPNRVVGFSNRRYPSMLLKASSGDRGRSNNSIISSDDDSHVISSSIWEADQLSQETLRGYWEESDGYFDPIYAGCLGDRVESMLVDVDLKVQATYQGERVPLVSLMSKLNGQAIVGHPVQIEILEDGLCDLLRRDDICEDLPDTDGNTALPQVWRTARRTTMHRAPRLPSSAAVDGEEARFSDLEREHSFKKQYTGHVKHKARLMKRHSSHIRRPHSHKFPKKLLKKANLASQKTRTLSSIAIEQRPGGKGNIHKLVDKSDGLHGSIKAGEMAPVITCVPVKLVFSRIREAIGRPPTAAMNHGVLTIASAERAPS